MRTLRIYEALNWASSFLLEKGREPKAAEWLLMHRLNVSSALFLAQIRDVLASADLEWFETAVKQHAEGIPIQHIMGEAHFYGRVFNVSPKVLIPRPETEELVHGLLELKEKMFRNQSVAYCDVGTGSGAIAISLALEDPTSNVTAVDLSPEALEVAEHNAHHLGASVQFVEGDLLTPFVGKRQFEVVVSNPPYIPSETIKGLDPLVRDHEPRLALDGGEDGLNPYRLLTEQLPQIVTSPSFLVGLEIGEGQGEAVKSLLKHAFNDDIHVEVRHDINGRERLVFGWRHLKA